MALFSQASHHLTSNHISVWEFILTVSEERPLERPVSDKCEIESFPANGLLLGKWCWRWWQSLETSELSKAPLFYYTFFLSSHWPILNPDWPLFSHSPQAEIGWNERPTSREPSSVTFLSSWRLWDREVNLFCSITTIFGCNQQPVSSLTLTCDRWPSQLYSCPSSLTGGDVLSMFF